MSTHRIHTENKTFYFITFTCYKWLPLLEETQIYNYLSFWFKKLKDQGCKLSGYVIMPNHMHLILYVEESCKSLNKVIAESKRFLAYEIVKRLKRANRDELLQTLELGVQPNERAKGKKHQVFRLSFDAKPLDEKEVESVLEYIHHNPVSGRWSLVDDYTSYRYSSAGFYEIGNSGDLGLVDYREVNSESFSSDSE